MGVPGEDREGVIDGVGFLRRINGGERPELPETVLVVGGGDVAMDACRVAKRLPGCKHVKVIYRRGPGEIPARRDELDGALKEGIEFVYNTQQVAVADAGGDLVLECVRTEPGEPDADGRRRPVPIAGSEHEIPCGMIIAAVGQTAASDELDSAGMMEPDRVRADFASMGTEHDDVFAAGDGAFGGSTIVMAMHHGQRAAYFIEAYLRGEEAPAPYRTPYRTRRVEVADDPSWEIIPRQEQDFHGLGDDPVSFPEIESTYDLKAAKDEAARCYRCDAETGSADYSVRGREDIFVMARTAPGDHARQKAMLERRLRTRDNPFPPERPASLDDLVFLPANLSRLVIDPYREACVTETALGTALEMAHPLLVAGLDEAPAEVRAALGEGMAASGCAYIGLEPPGGETPWLQLLVPGGAAPSPEAAGLIHVLGPSFRAVEPERKRAGQLLGLAVAAPALEEAIPHALENGFDMLVLDGSAGLEVPWCELGGAPDLTVMREAIAILRRLRKEEALDLIYFGGVRSGTDVAKLISLGCTAAVFGVAMGLALGGEIEGGRLAFSAGYNADDRRLGAENLLTASGSEASMMARCTGKTNIHNLEPEDLRAITLATAEATAIPLAGARG
jgi:hypothetical protein